MVKFAMGKSAHSIELYKIFSDFSLGIIFAMQILVVILKPEPAMSSLHFTLQSIHGIGLISKWVICFKWNIFASRLRMLNVTF